MNDGDRVQCQGCKSIFETDYEGPCPKCGKKEPKLFIKPLEGKISFRGDIQMSKIHSYIKTNKIGIFILIIINLVSPIIGVLIPGCSGIVIGYVLAIFGIVVGYFAIMKVREIEKYVSQ